MITLTAVRCKCGAMLYERMGNATLIKGKNHDFMVFAMPGSTISVPCHRCGLKNLLPLGEQPLD